MAETHDTSTRPPPLDLLTQELEPTRLHRRIRFLWLAGRPVPPRPLHHQLLIGRDIFVSERIDLHLVWGGGRIFIKPLPRYLLNPEFWRGYLTCRCHQPYHHHHTHHPTTKQHNEPTTTLERELSEAGPLYSPQERSGCFADHDDDDDDNNKKPLCAQRRLRQCAMGLLLSYIALITHESDFRIAIDKGLIPNQVTWPSWRRFAREVLLHTSSSNSSSGDHQNNNDNRWTEVADRFIYGELRLNRLNLIEAVLTGQFSRGYLATFNSFGSFYRYSSALIIAGTAYILLILSAMQVGLGTTKLAGDDAFQAASYGFAVFSILGPMGAVLAFLAVFVVIVAVNALRTRRFEVKRAGRIGRTWGAKGKMQRGNVRANRV
ncbi:uncharacterized protein C8A04DRAFT_40468 [Dichotomopilus funicola]|uniref:Uncharacterized protein n=1 Tax=Dichotomopilus funicola TaxID=1934379 RepID=A0AAN6UXM5_9PEZI|nr:hypothetical protein C8A04DRAFT_40468 [Dichotomopilus funicola]